MKLSTRHIHDFRKMILDWWPPHCRDLPWRRTRDPYRIMVSEVMLQQTQVIRVLAKYREFIEAFPTIFDLAKASPAQVLRIWKGMGYNRRALYLQRAANIIVDEYHGKFPTSERELRKLPGLGTYTARALLVFAFGQDVPLIDTNIRKIITHFFSPNQAQGTFDKLSVNPVLKGLKGRALEKEIEDVARQLIPPGKSWQWHQALMDYGALRLARARSGSLTKVSRRASISFRDSNRYYRGRIIDRLRDGKISEKKLVSEMRKTYTKPVGYIRSIIDSLLKDGLLKRTSHGVLLLPMR